jgi:uncharacterized protein (TIGR04255 family)
VWQLVQYKSFLNRYKEPSLSATERTPDFAKPPVVEFVLGAQFAPLENFNTGHFGLFWERLGRDEWPIAGEEPPLDPQFELFDSPRWRVARNLQFKLQPGFQPGRFTLQNADRDRMIQLQDTRLLLNWRKRTSGGEVKYPSYKVLICEFEQRLAFLEKFVMEHELGELQFNQWEITYVDSFPQEEFWQTPADWQRILPGLFGTLSTTTQSELSLEHRAAEWSYEIKPKKGRLHVIAQVGCLIESGKPSLLLNLTARGPIDGSGFTSLREGLDLGHLVSVREFLGMVDQNIKDTWNQK